MRNGKKISKARVYLGSGLSSTELKKRENEADEKLLSKKSGKINKEIEKIKSKTIKILRKNNVNKAGIFGSYSRGDYKKGSDVDIAVSIKNRDASLLDFIKLIRLLEEALKRKVDLVEYDSIKPRIKERILREEIRII